MDVGAGPLNSLPRIIKCLKLPSLIVSLSTTLTICVGSKV